ncbi:YSIRK-type signal peptide-containing protein, partial [Staphylococcus sp. HMSC065E08]|uniref:YSIRK-type signal peptide-containing protein n=1 Tax=Staphylococcus sp. HMSC065E08 TaxID=1739510 RepID=UPI00114CE7F3
MKSKNSKRLDFLPNTQNKYSIRKFTVGTASILLGTTLIFGASHEVQAAEENNLQDTAQTTSSEPQTVDLNSDLQAQQPTEKQEIIPSSEEATSQEQNTKVELQQNENHVEAQPQAADQEKNNSESTERQEAELKTDASNNVQNHDKDIEKPEIATRALTDNASNEDVPYGSYEIPQEFIQKYEQSTDREKLVKELLSENYEPNDVEGILGKLNVDYNSISPENLAQEILRAGLEYANEQTSKYTVYAVRAIPEDSSSATTYPYGDDRTHSNVNPEGGTASEVVGALKTAITIPATGISVKGNGTTYVGQKPSNYTFTAIPDHENNVMKFTVKYNASAGTGDHYIDLGGLKLGKDYGYRPTIPYVYTQVGTVTRPGAPSTIHGSLKEGVAKPGYPEGYAMDNRPAVTNAMITNGGYGLLEFNVPVNNWNGDLSIDAFPMMFSQTGPYEKSPNPFSTDNYFYDKSEVVLDANPDINITQSTKEKDEVAPFETEYVTTSDLPVGQQRIKSEGQTGIKTYQQKEVRYKDKVIGRTLENGVITEQPINRVIELGVGNITPVENVMPPVLDPKLSGMNTVTGETIPNAKVNITVGLTNYTTTSDATGKFSQDLATPLKEEEIISATVEKDGKTSLPGKTIVPRDVKAPTLAFKSTKTTQGGVNGTLVTVTNKETGEKLGETFIPDGKSVGVQSMTKQPDGSTQITFTDGNSFTIAKGDKGDKGENGQPGHSITILNTQDLPNGDKYVLFSDNTSITIPKGAKGDQGDSIKIISTNPTPNGPKVTFSDGSFMIIPKGKDGEDGRDGRDGQAGRDGDSVTITSTKTQSDGSIKVTFSTGKSILIPKGDKGDKGDTGATGAQGAKGEKGDSGQDGTSVTITETKTLPNGNKEVTFSDGKTLEIPRGDKGDVGEKGTDGTSVTVDQINKLPNGDSEVVFSDGKKVIIPKGEKGDKGDPGQVGAAGPKGDKG